MKSLNRVFLFGNLGRRPELMTAKSGKTYAKLNLATTRAWTAADGQRAEKTDWHRVMVWGNLGNTCARYLDKGSPVLIEGFISHWDSSDEEGKKRHETSITAKEVTFAGFPRRDGAASPANSEEPSVEAMD